MSVPRFDFVIVAGGRSGTMLPSTCVTGHLTRDRYCGQVGFALVIPRLFVIPERSKAESKDLVFPAPLRHSSSGQGQAAPVGLKLWDDRIVAESF